MYDRAMQKLHALALEPVAEVIGDDNSYGFRKGRSAKDACERIFNVLSTKVSATWILEGDIKGCFDNINHEWIQQNISMNKKVMRQFLKAGYVHKGKLFPTTNGTPQGGPISSLYANLTLDGLETLIQDRYHRNSKGNIESHYRAKTKVNFIRYCDDFIVTAATQEIAEEVKVLISDFLKERGLELSDEKTLITNINKGFDFLGWNFRKHKGKLLIKPSRDSIKSVVSKLSTILLKEGKAMKQSDIIRRLNAVLRGWANYHKHVVSSQVFSNVNNTLYLLLEQWAKHRHPNKSKWWRLNRYWHAYRNTKWKFMVDENDRLIDIRRIKIERHTKLKLGKNPYIDKEYFEQRKQKVQTPIVTARNSEEMLEPYEWETLMYGS